LARDLCLRFKVDISVGYLAGMVHDICKSMDDNELIRLALMDGKGISSLEKKKPGLLHGRAAAIFLRDNYNILDQEILDAIASHVTGNIGMGALAKILYIADKIEVSRGYVAPHIKEMCEKADLEELFSAVLENNVSFLNSKRIDIAEGTQRLLDAMGEKSPGNIAKEYP
jgi:nicotinate-nucleotide adenylyltransferase